MRRYLWIAVSLAAAAMVSLAVFAVFLFTRNLEIARQASRDRMANLAAYTVEHLNQDLFSYTLVLTPENLPESFVAEKSAWLGQLARATGLQRMALTDSLGNIYIASEADLRSGSRITARTADSACFEAAARSGQAVFCNREAASSSLQSLYHPFDFFGNRHLIVLESDSNFLVYLEQYRTFIAAVSGFLIAVLTGLLIALVLIDRKARAALQLSRRNEQLAFLGRASAELAHELKNPLAIIKASVDVLRRQIDPQRENTVLHFLSDETMRLSRLISNILGLSRDRQLDLRAFNPKAVAEAAGKATQDLYPQVEVRIQIPADLPVLGDSDAVRQIIENLLRNSAQAMGGQGLCHVLGRRDSGRGLLFLGDRGPGIPQAMRENLFDPFVTGNKAGTGLGLAIVRSLIERMNWSIALLHDAEAAQALGDPQAKTCFLLTAPLAKGG